MNDVELFIDRFKFSKESSVRKSLEYAFTSGNCYYFALILKERFGGQIYYLPIANHFICKIENEYYDITGKASMNESPILWTEYMTYDKIASSRIIRDCINFESR